MNASPLLRLWISNALNKILPKKMVFPILKGPLKGKKWYTRCSNLQFALGSFEHELVKHLETEIKKSNIFYDIGAHVGYHTMIASLLVGNDGEVVAFEPLPRNLYYLKKHLEINNIDNVELIESAVSDESGYTYLEPGDHPSTPHITEFKSNGNHKIRTYSLDDLINSKSINPPDVMKIDVEGAELMVLKGSIYILKNYKPKIFLELHSKELFTECKSFLKDYNYSFKSIEIKEQKSRTIFAF